MARALFAREMTSHVTICNPLWETTSDYFIMRRPGRGTTVGWEGRTSFGRTACSSFRSTKAIIIAASEDSETSGGQTKGTVLERPCLP